MRPALSTNERIARAVVVPRERCSLGTVKNAAIAFVVLVVMASLAAYDAAASSSATRVTLIPVDGFPAERAQRIGDWLQRQLAVTVVVAAPMRLPDALLNPKRKQLVAESSLDWFAARLAAQGTTIGLTQRDMYPRQGGWNFVFAERQTRSPIGLVSSWHMDPVRLGGVADDALFERRLQKYVLRYTLLLAFGRSLVNNPRSVLTDSVTSIDDLDGMEASAAPPQRDPQHQTWLIGEGHVCSHARAEAQRLLLQPAATSAQLITLLRKLVAVDASLIARFGALAAEPTDRPLVTEAVALLRRQLSYDRSAVARLTKGFSRQLVAALVRQDSRYSRTIRAVFVELGLTGCASA